MIILKRKLKITVKTRLFRRRPYLTAASYAFWESKKKLMAQIIAADVNDSIIYGWASSIMPFWLFLLLTYWIRL